MQLKPQDIFIGVIDFFSVILPGALITYFLMGQLYGDIFGAGKVFPSPETQTQQWLVFLFATYIIGQINFLIASFLLDKIVYYTYLSNRFCKKNFNLGYRTATAIRNQYLLADSWITRLIHTNSMNREEGQELLNGERREIINTFKWAQNFLAIKYPETLTDIKKIVADSKLFRSLVIAFIIVGSVLLAKGEWLTGGCFMVFSLLSLFRYGDLRYKSTQEAYELIVTIHHLEKSAMLARHTAEPDVSTQDNRMAHFMSAEETDAWAGRISQLTKGLDVTTDVLAIPVGDTWKVTNAPGEETLFCLSGRCVTNVGTDDGLVNKVILSPNAIMPIPSNTSFEITNNQQEPLILMALKPVAI